VRFSTNEYNLFQNSNKTTHYGEDTMNLFGKPDAKRLEQKEDIKGLGKLLSNKEPRLRGESVNALLNLLDKYAHDDRKVAEVKLIFQELNRMDSNEVLSILMEYLEKRFDITAKGHWQGNSFGRGYEMIIYAVLNKSGQKQLIELQKKVASFMNTNLGSNYVPCESFHQRVSEALIMYAVRQQWTLETLIGVIPYACLQYNEWAGKLRDIIRKSEPLSISQEKFDEICDSMRKLPKSPGGLRNFVLRYGEIDIESDESLGGSLLKKLNVASI
jgi:hypothetical protein